MLVSLQPSLKIIFHFWYHLHVALTKAHKQFVPSWSAPRAQSLASEPMTEELKGLRGPGAVKVTFSSLHCVLFVPKCANMGARLFQPASSHSSCPGSCCAPSTRSDWPLLPLSTPYPPQLLLLSSFWAPAWYLMRFQNPHLQGLSQVQEHLKDLMVKPDRIAQHPPPQPHPVLWVNNMGTPGCSQSLNRHGRQGGQQPCVLGPGPLGFQQLLSSVHKLSQPQFPLL